MLDQSQQAAVDNISQLDRRVYLLIGAGGSGKSFTIKHLVSRLWVSLICHIKDETTYFAAPTGRAAKVLNDAFSEAGFRVENEAKTIHRMLEFHPKKGWGFNEMNKLDASLVIIDEASMVDSALLATVIAALPDGCVLILVGDDEQLLPVNPGSPFIDLITCGPQELINRLTVNHRQQQGSLIANACMAIREGGRPQFGEKGQHTLGGELEDDLFFVEEEDKEAIPEIVTNICRPWHDARLDYAVLSPQRTGECGVENLNKYLQEKLNPAVEGKPQMKVAWLTFRLGDKVMQTANNYNLDVFNGSNGVIVDINDEFGAMCVNFDGQHVVYDTPENIKQLVLGYCMTVHKSQGSQWKKGVLVCHSSHYYIWNRSLLYTGMSRFRDALYIIGNRKAMKRGLSNVVSGERNTYLKLKLKGKEA